MSYSDFKRHYSTLSTEELLRILASSELVPEAARAMQSELMARRAELERDDFEVYVGPTAPPPPKHLGLWLWAGITALSALFGLAYWLWEAVVAWLNSE